MSGLLAGKTTLITGGSSGIGLAIGHAFTAAGSDLIIAARDAGRLEVAAAALRAHGGKVRAVATDPLKDDDIARLFAEADGLDVLINNAGGNVWARTEHITATQWRAAVGDDESYIYAIEMAQIPRPGHR